MSVRKIKATDSTLLMNASDIKIRYSPHGAALQLFHCHDEEILMDGPAGTGKSFAALQKIHLVLAKYPGSRGFMARKTRASMTNSCVLMFQDQVLRGVDGVVFNKTDQVFKYPNGSMLAVIGLDDPERIKSTEFDIGYIQEATECTENDVEIATSRLRHGVVPYQQLIMDCNPDKPNHWLKKRCDIPRLVILQETGERIMTSTTRMQSIHQDNPKYYDNGHKKWTAEGLKYMAKLDRMSGVRRDRLYKGLWVAAEGLVYGNWDAEYHMKNLSDLPDNWREWRHYWAVDFGFIHPFCWGDWIEDPKTQDLYLLHQIYKTKVLVEDHARHIRKIVGNRAPTAIICDHDAEGRATLERHLGNLFSAPMITLPAYKKIQEGVNAVQARLRPDGIGPKLYLIRDSLVEVDETLKEEAKPYKVEDEWDGYVWDKGHNEDANSKKDELPVDKDNHGMDMTRYVVAFADSLGDDPQEQEYIATYEDEVSISPF